MIVNDVYDHLESVGVAGGSTGWALRRRRIDDNPATGDQLVVVTEDGGTSREIATAVGMGDAAMANLGVLVTVRAAQWDGDASLAKATEVMDALHGLLNTVVGSTLYLRVRALTAGPVFAGFDDNGRPLHTIAFRMLREISPASV